MINYLIEQYNPILKSLNSQIEHINKFGIENNMSSINSHYHFNHIYNNLNLNIINENKKHLFTSIKNDNNYEISLYRKMVELNNHGIERMIIDLFYNFKEHTLAFKSFRFNNLSFNKNIPIKFNISFHKHFDDFYINYDLFDFNEIFSISFEPSKSTEINKKQDIYNETISLIESPLLKLFAEKLLFIKQSEVFNGESTNDIIFKLKNRSFMSEQKEYFRLLYDIDLNNVYYIPSDLFNQYIKKMDNS